MDRNRRRIDQVADPAFVEDLDRVPMEELRARRRMLDELDTELSYYRRLLHGRMDLLAFELRRRRGEERRSLIEALPEILAEHDAGPSSGPARELPIAAPELPDRGRRAVDRALGDDFLTHLPSIADADLEEIQAGLAEAERQVSEQRALVFHAHEAILAELARRYREGLADLDELLSS